jgi:phage repressor protein C with HTH and peptisase S24 domain
MDFAKKIGWSQSLLADVEKKHTRPGLEKMIQLSEATGTSLDWLVSGREAMILDTRGERVSIGREADLCMVPLLAQKASAGSGQELLDVEQIGFIPFINHMLRGLDLKRARAVEVRGDSMTGVHLNDGDFVVFVVGELRGDGIYVIRVGDELYVKRIQFDPINRKIIIMSENPRYPDRAESSDSGVVEVVGKVYGWIHAHPY